MVDVGQIVNNGSWTIPSSGCAKGANAVPSGANTPHESERSHAAEVRCFVALLRGTKGAIVLLR